MLGPLLFVLYTVPIADIMKSYNVKYHLYVDDSFPFNYYLLSFY